MARGLTLGLSAYLIWGSFPIIISLLGFATPWEIVVWRILFGLIAGVLFILVGRSWRTFVSVFSNRKARPWLILSSIMIMINWTVYVYAVAIGHVVESSLGYFINPLVTIVLAVFFLRERLRPLQWVAVGLGLVAVLTLTFDYGRLPWIALSLAISFGLYGLAKNKLGDQVTALHSYTFETVVLTPVAIAMLVFVASMGPIEFTRHGWAGATGLALYGFLTAIPLILFGVAAKHLPLSWIGFMQYLTPIIQFILGITYFHEAMPAARWVGFALVWLGLSVLSVDMLRRARKNRA
ncbi:MAG: EamA family transporter RarD [Microbacteriaceae bacterium]|nr:EamA family transporter RarD [Microbacteriaceae bacterium]